MRALFLALPIVLAACGEQMTPEEEAEATAAAVAEVRKANEPPAKMVDPEPMSFDDIEQADIFGVSCGFIPDDGSPDPVAIALMDTAYAKIDGMIEPFAPDIGSPDSPFGTKTKFDSTRRSMEWTMLDEESEQVGIEMVEYRATLRFKDRRGRVVYEQAGKAECGS